MVMLLKVCQSFEFSYFLQSCPKQGNTHFRLGSSSGNLFILGIHVCNDFQSKGNTSFHIKMPHAHVWLVFVSLIPSRQNESHIFTKDLKMNPPISTSQVNLNWSWNQMLEKFHSRNLSEYGFSIWSSLTSLLLDRLHIFSENIWFTFQKLKLLNTASPTRPKYIQVSCFSLLSKEILVNFTTK